MWDKFVTFIRLGVEGLLDPKRTPIILYSDGGEADAANLIQDDNIDV